MLIDLVDRLLESLPEDAFPGENHTEVVLEMLIGTIRPVAEGAGEQSVRSAAALLADSSSRTIADLERAGELARRTQCAERRRNRDQARADL